MKKRKNYLNNLSNKNWLVSTKSVYFSNERDTLNFDSEVVQEFKDLLEKKNYDLELKLGQKIQSVLNSRPIPRDKLKSQHPATFAESDINRLITFFTKKNEWILDPFAGVGSTLISCLQTGRNGYGIELTAKWVNIANKRIRTIENKNVQVKVLKGDARVAIKQLNKKFQFIITSPPYWNILKKDKDHKVLSERINKGLATKYSNKNEDLGNIESYHVFLEQLGNIFKECKEILDKRRYMCVIVSDFRHKSKFYSFHSDLAKVIEKHGFSLEGITILVQNNKNLYPYGMPYAFVSNIIHQYILIFRNP